MTCERCGRPTSRRRHCADCARDLRQEERARLEDADLLAFETIKRCRDCGSTSDEVDGGYLDENPGVWVCDSCRTPGGSALATGERSDTTHNARALERGDSA